MNTAIGTAIIGLGGRGKHFARLYNQHAHPGFELRAVCDFNTKLLDEAGRKFGGTVRCYQDMHEMFRQPGVDAVIVATNDTHHVDPTVAALKAGKHVLVEKPLCQSIQEAQLIAEVVRASPGVFMIGFELRACPVFQLMKQLLDEGRIGDVKVGHCFDNVSVGGNYFFHNSKRQQAFYKTLLLQKASHALDLLNWFMGSEPVKVYGTGGLDYYGAGAEPDRHCRACSESDKCAYHVDSRGFQLDYDAVIEVEDECVWSPEMNLNDNSQLLISYANGSKATFQECHFTPEYSREFWLVGTKGKMYGYYDNPGRFLIRIEYSHARARRTEEWKPEHTSGSHGGGDERLRDEFYRRIVSAERTNEPLESAYYSTALAICGENSIESGLPVQIPKLDR